MPLPKVSESFDHGSESVADTPQVVLTLWNESRIGVSNMLASRKGTVGDSHLLVTLLSDRFRTIDDSSHCVADKLPTLP